MGTETDGILYYQDPITGEYKRLAEIQDFNLNLSDDSVIDERITKWIHGNDEMTFTVELPKVIDTTAREVDGDAVNRRGCVSGKDESGDCSVKKDNEEF